MFRHALVPLDFSDKNDAAIEAAISLSLHPDSHVHLLHVVEQIEGLADEELRDFYKQLEKRAQKELNRLRARLDEKCIAASATVCFGKRAEEIVRVAEEQGADLIVLSSHRFEPGGSYRAWPTISHRVALLSPLPVLLVR